MNAEHPGSRVAIAVAPNGGRKTKADHPALPLDAAELAATARECLEAGASMIHLHVRRPDGTHLLDAGAYRAAIDAVTAAVGDRLVIQVTSESLGLYSPAEQIAVIKRTRPEAVSLALRELMPAPDDQPAFLDLLDWLRSENVLPQIILYDAADARKLAAIRSNGHLPWTDVPVLYVLGRYTVSQTSAPADLLPFLAEDMPRFGHWSVCAFGPREAACVTAAALLGGHARVGFENNTLLPDGQTADGNADLVGCVAKAAGACGLTPMSAAELRASIAAALGD